MQTPNLISELFKAIDATNVDKFTSFLDDNAKFKFGNFPEVAGKDAIRKSVQDFFSSINGLSHKIINTWEVHNTVICQGEVTYTRKDNGKLTIPFVNIFGMKENLIKDYLIYIDITPLYSKS